MSGFHGIEFHGGYLVAGTLGEVHFVNEVAFWVMSELAEKSPSERTSSSVAAKFQAQFGGSEREAIESINSVIEWQEENGLRDESVRAEGVGSLAPAGSSGKPFHSATLLVNGQDIGLAVEDGAIFALLSPMIAHLRTSGRVAARREVQLSGSPREKRYELYLDGKLEGVGPNIFYARHMALEGIALASISTPDCHSLLHAAAVNLDGTVVLLCGPSGSGKTTLLLGLLSNGAEFISDDIVPLVGSDSLAIPMPFAIGVKSGSLEFAETLFPGLGEASPIRLGNRLVRYVAPDVPPNAVARPAGIVILPEYAPGESAEIRELDPLEAFALAGELGSWFRGRPDCLRHLASFFERVPVARIRYGSLDEAIVLIRDLIRATDDGARTARQTITESSEA